MARFPAYQRNILALGKILATASVDRDARSRLVHDPAGELRKAGLPEETVNLFNFQVVVSAAGAKAPVVIPWRLNQTKLSNRDPEYLAQVAESLGYLDKNCGNSFEIRAKSDHDAGGSKAIN